MDAINVEKATQFVLSCCNSDGGFGSKPNAESHAGLIYCCVGYLSITSMLPDTPESMMISNILLFFQITCICWTAIDWAGGCARGNCQVADLMDVQKSYLMCATPGGCSPP